MSSALYGALYFDADWLAGLRYFTSEGLQYLIDLLTDQVSSIFQFDVAQFPKVTLRVCSLSHLLCLLHWEPTQPINYCMFISILSVSVLESSNSIFTDNSGVGKKVKATLEKVCFLSSGG